MQAAQINLILVKGPGEYAVFSGNVLQGRLSGSYIYPLWL